MERRGSAESAHRATAPSSQQNLILRALPGPELALVERHARIVPMRFKDRLTRSDEVIREVCFPLTGVISLVVALQEGEAAEVATVGHEGVVGVGVLSGACTSPVDWLVQVPGEALALPAHELPRIVEAAPSFRRLLFSSNELLLAQAAQTVACNRGHDIAQRCARWFLLTHDRVEGEEFPMTHEFLSYMLGIRRPSVTRAAGALQRKGLIEYRRGRIRVVNRAELEQMACECYWTTRKRQERLLGASPR